MAHPPGCKTLRMICSFLESGGDEAIVRPWAWIIWIGVGPVVDTLCHELYSFLVVSSRRFYINLSHISLTFRTTQTGVLARVEAIITSLVFDHALRIRLKSETIESNSTADGAPAVEPKTSNANFVGKINNLVTSDLANISGGNDFLRLRMPSPHALSNKD